VVGMGFSLEFPSPIPTLLWRSRVPGERGKSRAG
jgi:hypothetical protein